MTELLLNTRDEFKNLIPPLSDEERVGLEQSLITEGNRVPIDTWHGYIVDGHNRYDICHKHNIPLKPPNELKNLKTIEDVKIWIIKNQLGRRNISDFTRCDLVLKGEDIIAEKAKQNYQEYVGRPSKSSPTLATISKIDTREELAYIAKVSHGTIDKVKKIKKAATPEQIKKLEDGKATINQVYVNIKRDEAKEAVKQAEWPAGKYRIIYADPPWKYGNYSNTEPEHQTTQDRHYPTMTPDEISNLPVRDLALDNAVLFIWSTSPILEDVFKVINSWGFKYKASFVWDKVKHNMGHFNSVRHELLLIATRGSCQPDNKELIDSVQSIERNGHSEKPEFFREVIVKLYPYGPRIELFATKITQGWEVYGNQIDA